ncbi:hypothetical protein GT030_19915 [Streptomyces sp. SID1328]|uniref:hypothetical protein n=1 Tax=Streptomyces sp. SID1328 TaxID=2690250 RepID=UPI001367A250|nr:hypothetical protein [Streptomyces sp. SID1328]MYV41075.1 hypothetical protein [Streptomyces sp. SID1328]
MAPARVVVHPPGETGGRRVTVNDEFVGTAWSAHDLTVFLQRAGLEGWDELDVLAWDGIEWRGAGIDVWA